MLGFGALGEVPLGSSPAASGGGGGTTYNQSALATTAASASTLRNTGKPLQALDASIATLIRALTHGVVSTTAPVSALVRQTAKVLLATTTPIRTIVTGSIFFRPITATANTVASLVRQAGKVLQNNVTILATLVTYNTFFRSLTAAVSSIGTLSRLSIFFRSFASTTVPEATLRRMTDLGKVITTGVISVLNTSVLGTADLITMAADGYRYNITPDVLPAGSYTGSLYMKVASGTVNVGLRAFGTGDDQITTAVLTTTWQRFTVTITTTGDGQISFGVDQRVGVGGPGVAANPIVWGLMINDGVQAQSYIPTNASPITVTPSSLTYAATYVFYVDLSVAILAAANLVKQTGKQLQALASAIATSTRIGALFRSFQTITSPVATMGRSLGKNLEVAVTGVLSKVLSTSKRLTTDVVSIGSFTKQSIIIYTRRIVTYIRTLRLW